MTTRSKPPSLWLRVPIILVALVTIAANPALVLRWPWALVLEPLLL